MRLAATAFTVLGLCVAALMMYVAWQHNPQGEFHDATGISWRPWLAIGAAWFAIIAGVPIAIAALVSALLHFRRH